MRITLRDVAAGYGAHNVLQGVSFDLRAGEFAGLIGPNGAGKSTLLRVATGTLTPRHGRVTMDGDAVERLSRREIARRIAVVPQSEPTLFEFTVREVVMMGRHARISNRGETHEDYAAVARAMAATDTLSLADRSITGLSGGEHRRVLIARALAQQAPTLVLDEPTAHLDITHQTDLLAMARRLADADDVAVLAALHDLNHAAEFCDRLILLAEGRIVADGTPDEVITAAHLAAAYGVELLVGKSPASGQPYIYPAAPLPAAAEGSARRVHVICGGGTGAAVMSGLLRRGAAVTAGVLNQLDSDEEAATALGVDHVAEAPFSAIGPEARAACDEMMRRAQAVVVTDMPFGHGNLANLELALKARRAGLSVYLLGGGALDERDYTGGQAASLWETLLAEGAVLASDTSELLNKVFREAHTKAAP